MDPTGEGVFGLVLEVRLWTLDKRDERLNRLKKYKISFSFPMKQKEKKTSLNFGTPGGARTCCPRTRPGPEGRRG